MSKKNRPTEKQKLIIAGDFAGVGIFEVQYETQAETEDPAQRWFEATTTVLEFDAQSAIEKVNEKVVERYERLRLIGVRLLARAKM